MFRCPAFRRGSHPTVKTNAAPKNRITFSFNLPRSRVDVIKSEHVGFIKGVLKFSDGWGAEWTLKFVFESSRTRLSALVLYMQIPVY